MIKIELYQKENGEIPVKNFIKSLPCKLQAKAYFDIKLLQEHGQNLREPYVKSIKGIENKDLFELRIKFSNDIARIFYFVYIDNKYILLNGFMKKSQKISKTELKRARKYMQDYIRRKQK